ncbi:MAG: sigma-70 family RNA polymerase sigma factor [Planctomycetota bacterium]|nr:sigma-70 family RNA polymerase sigma factor [Planctomycetota bacterium]
MDCKTCLKKEFCQELCKDMKKKIPSIYDGRINHGHLSSEALHRIVRRRWITKVILDWRHMLSGRQRQVIDMYYNENLTQDEIAKRLGIAQKNVSVYLSRAYRAIAAWSRREREEEKNEDRDCPESVLSDGE